MNKILGLIMFTICLIGGMLFILLICIPMVLWMFLRNRDVPDQSEAPFIEHDDPQLHHFMFDGRKQLERTTVEFFIK